MNSWDNCSTMGQLLYNGAQQIAADTCFTALHGRATQSDPTTVGQSLKGELKCHVCV